MSSFDNPFGRERAPDHAERVEAIKLWARQALALTDETVVSVSEFGCAKPTCPNKQTVIVVMSPDAPTRKISIHRSIADISESDVAEAGSDLMGKSSS
jgi:hypothetical protein